MLVPTIVMAVVAIAVLIFAYQKGVHIESLTTSWRMIIQIFPMLVLAMLAAGTIQHLISPELITKWIGNESGFRGILIGTAMGACVPGGPYISLPVAAGLMRTGAGIGTLVAFITSWSLIGLSNLPMQIGIMGWQFSAIRMACTFFFAPVAGLLANLIFSRVRLF